MMNSSPRIFIVVPSSDVTFKVSNALPLCLLLSIFTLPTCSHLLMTLDCVEEHSTAIP
jgi:hypothetical protein